MELQTKEVEAALKVIIDSIANSEKMLDKFAVGSSQHSLLKNRIQALNIAKAYLTQDASKQAYTEAEIKEALTPINSLLSKCEKGISHQKEGSSAFKRFQSLIDAMNVAKIILEKEINDKKV